MDEKLKAFWAKLNTDIAELWTNNKLFLILFGVLIIVIKFRNILIDIIVSNGKEIFEEAKKKDAELSSSEDSNSKEADKLIEHSKKLADDSSSVDEDWNKK